LLTTLGNWQQSMMTNACFLHLACSLVYNAIGIVVKPLSHFTKLNWTVSWSGPCLVNVNVRCECYLMQRVMHLSAPTETCLFMQCHYVKLVFGATISV